MLFSPGFSSTTLLVEQEALKKLKESNYIACLFMRTFPENNVVHSWVKIAMLFIDEAANKFLSAFEAVQLKTESSIFTSCGKHFSIIFDASLDSLQRTHLKTRHTC